MIILDVNNFSSQIKEIKYEESFDWKCKKCGKEHHESQRRNFDRRKIKCVCQSNDERAKEINKELYEVGYEFLYEKENSYFTSANGKIECKKPIYVKCLKCGKESFEYYHNIRKLHKRCNCNDSKNFTRNLSTEEFLNKWPALNKKNFELLDEYINRNTKYKIKCKNCGHEDIRWGITLIDDIISCKYCDLGSKNEQLIGYLLEKKKINYIREYLIDYNNHHHRFDFYLPELKIIIEYNGAQHYMPIDYFGGQEQFILRQQRDKEKEEYCKENNIKLIIFDYTQTSKDIENKIGLMFND